MTYAIAHIVLGIDLTFDPYSRQTSPFEEFHSELVDHIEGVYDEKTRRSSNPTPGFDRRYTGGDVAPQWFGIQMGEFDECTNMLGDLLISKLTATADHRQAYAALLDGLRANDKVSDGLKALIERTEPVVFLAWGTS